MGWAWNVWVGHGPNINGPGPGLNSSLRAGPGLTHFSRFGLGLDSNCGPGLG